MFALGFKQNCIDCTDAMGEFEHLDLNIGDSPKADSAVTDNQNDAVNPQLRCKFTIIHNDSITTPRLTSSSMYQTDSTLRSSTGSFMSCYIYHVLFPVFLVVDKRKQI